MFIKLGSQFSMWLFVADSGGNPIIDDSPYVTVKHLENELFWNGVMWVEEEARLYMESLNDGSYVYHYEADEPGHIEFYAKSDRYSTKSKELIEVRDEADISFDWQINVPFEIMLPYKDDKKRPSIVIEFGDYYFDGTEFIPLPTEIPMDVINPGDNTSWKASFTYIPTELGEHSIVATINGRDYNIILNVVEHADSVAPVIITHETIKGTDGKDSVVLGPDMKPMAGVIVKAYDKKEKELVTTAVTDINGKWQMIIRPGSYIVMFEKDGYVTVSLDRTVIGE